MLLEQRKGRQKNPQNEGCLRICWPWSWYTSSYLLQKGSGRKNVNIFCLLNDWSHLKYFWRFLPENVNNYNKSNSLPLLSLGHFEDAIHLYWCQRGSFFLIKKKTIFLLTVSYGHLSWSWQNPAEICMGLKFLFTAALYKDLFYSTQNIHCQRLSLLLYENNRWEF